MARIKIEPGEASLPPGICTQAIERRILLMKSSSGCWDLSFESMARAFYAQTSRLTSQPVERPVPAGGSVSSGGYERTRYRDFTTSLGGPILRDRLWFFGAYQYLRDYDSQPGADPQFARVYEQDKISGKLTWRFTPSLQLMQSFHEEFWVNANPPTLVTPYAATLRLCSTATRRGCSAPIIS